MVFGCVSFFEGYLLHRLKSFVIIIQIFLICILFLALSSSICYPLLFAHVTQSKALRHGHFNFFFDLRKTRDNFKYHWKWYFRRFEKITPSLPSRTYLCELSLKFLFTQMQYLFSNVLFIFIFINAYAFKYEIYLKIN